MLLVLQRCCVPHHSYGCFVGSLTTSLRETDIDRCRSIKDEAYGCSVKSRRSVVNGNSCIARSVRMNVVNGYCEGFSFTQKSLTNEG